MDLFPPNAPWMRTPSLRPCGERAEPPPDLRSISRRSCWLARPGPTPRICSMPAQVLAVIANPALAGKAPARALRISQANGMGAQAARKAGRPAVLAVRDSSGHRLIEQRNASLTADRFVPTVTTPGPVVRENTSLRSAGNRKGIRNAVAAARAAEAWTTTTVHNRARSSIILPKILQSAAMILWHASPP